MNTGNETIPNWKRWAGRLMTGFATVALAGSATAKMAHVPQIVDGLTKAGIPAGSILPIALLELLCLTLYLVPRTTVLGMLLLTGYFGGATVTHLIGGESVISPLIVGLIIWGGAYFRVAELKHLIPLRAPAQRSGAGADHQSELPNMTRAGRGYTSR